MKTSIGFWIAAVLAFSLPAAGEEAPTESDLRRAIEKAIPVLETGTRGSADERSCYTCHNQGLPILAFVEAQSRGFEIDADNLDRQVEHTARHLKRGRNSYLKGTGQGGKADTAGSALWALDAAGYPKDEITDAVVHFLLEWNDDTPHWSPQSNRPPSEGSNFTSTFLALRGLDAYGTETKRKAIAKRREAARQWLMETEPESTEASVFRLLALKQIEADSKPIAEAVQDLLDRQRDDGGWAQLPDRESDAYATGSVLWALADTGGMAPDAEAFRRGLTYLASTQKEDGSWHVVSRSRPIQEYFETGFPHGEDQFISSSATGWATLALLQAFSSSEDSN